jgi:hypothetical protein
VVWRLCVVKPVLSGVEGVSRESPIACHAEAVCEGRSILLCCRLRFRRGRAISRKIDVDFAGGQLHLRSSALS